MLGAKASRYTDSFLKPQRSHEKHNYFLELESAHLPARSRRWRRLASPGIAAPVKSLAQEASQPAGSATRQPIRMAFMEFPTALPQHWWPTGQPGREFELTARCGRWRQVKSKIQILSGLDHRNATPGPDGAR